ncbi:MAG: hypothetical protein COA84_10990 [Robiginitomaculum sp.]|nr:MAG: hypothetical protein COA84_10990 [Robiginitomaculum sp.]
MENSLCPSLSENDKFRSDYVWNLIQNIQNKTTCDTHSRTPRVMIQYWHDSSEIPSDVQSCIDSWNKFLATRMRKVLFNDTLAREFICSNYPDKYSQAFNKCHHPAMRCDYFRLCYIYKLGGFYLDADEFFLGKKSPNFFLGNKLKIQPLCYDKTCRKMVPSTLFMRESKPPANWIFYFNNNPLIAPANHPLIKLALDRATHQISNSSSNDDIQSITGPGNLTASTVRHAMTLRKLKRVLDFEILIDWDDVAISKWPLSYRNDARNWRLGKELWG